LEDPGNDPNGRPSWLMFLQVFSSVIPGNYLQTRPWPITKPTPSSSPYFGLSQSC